MGFSKPEGPGIESHGETGKQATEEEMASQRGGPHMPSGRGAG